MAEINDQKSQHLDHDVIIIGAGLSGICALYNIRKLGVRVKVLEAGSDVGGAWFWNRYPGARFDSESWSYGFSFSQEVLDEWHWKEHFSPQPENLRYAQFVVDKLKLRDDIQFNTRIKASHYQESSQSWLLTDEDGATYSTRFLVTALGPLAIPTLPNIPGVHDFKGTSHHTGRWPHEPVKFENKRVAIIGVGATGIQAIQEIAKTVGHLTVFQRTPNWTAPLRNSQISEEEMKEIRARYPEIFKLCIASGNGFHHMPDTRKTLEVPEAEREAHWEAIYAKPGFSKWLSGFSDNGTNQEANDAYSRFNEKKIRARVDDPWTADKLIPKNHGFGTRRLPLESGYYEVYNQPNVRLIDLHETPIVRITEKGIKTSAEDFEFDIIIYATGFDAITGGYDAMNIKGENGALLKDRWKTGIYTFLGITNASFPNMFMVMGPHSAFGNIPRSIEYGASWVTNCIEYCLKNDITYIAATEEGVEWWTTHVNDLAKGALSNNVDSWITGVNHNVPGRRVRIVARYNGTITGFREKCDKIAAEGYQRMITA